jgi:hypothetical protein
MLSACFQWRQPPLTRSFSGKGRAKHLQRGVQFRLCIVTMRAEAEVVASFAVVPEGGNYFCFFQRGEEFGAARALMAEGGDAARGGAGEVRAEDWQPGSSRRGMG